MLSGPILRRAELARIFIWLVTSKAVRVNAEIYLYKDIQTSKENAKPIGFGSSTSIALGEYLYITIVIARADDQRGLTQRSSNFGYRKR